MGIIVSSLLIITETPSCQAQTKTVNYTWYFHNNQVILRDNNGSFIAYDGVDGTMPSGSGSQVTLQSKITGNRDGWDYYSAVAIWAKPLDTDLHVKGTVSITAYISSTFKLTSLFSGGSYGFGVVDIDENNNEVIDFVTEGPIAIARNPFTKDPTQYSLTVPVDYVFKKGHSIGFAVGFGATVEDFEATIYFDSANTNSGVTLPVVETTPSDTVAPEFPSTMIPIVAAVCLSTFAVAAFLRLRKPQKAAG
jgi:hypothetical protein